MAAVGLVEPRQSAAAAKLGEFSDTYIAGRTDAKPRTILNLIMFRNRLTAFFGADREIATIKKSDANDWVIHLKAQYAAATVARTIKGARQLLNAAVDAEIITANPFKGIKAGSPTDKELASTLSPRRTPSAYWTAAPIPNGG